MILFLKCHTTYSQELDTEPSLMLHENSLIQVHLLSYLVRATNKLLLYLK